MAFTEPHSGGDQARLSQGIQGNLPPLHELQYLAPEVSHAILSGQPHMFSSEATDILALGMVIYSIGMGQVYPFRGRSGGEVRCKL